MTWQGTSRRDRLPADWKQRREVVIARADGRCEWIVDGERCLEPGTDVDHIVTGDDHRHENLQLLCRRHHLTKTAKHAAAVRTAKYNRRRPPEKHPGLL